MLRQGKGIKLAATERIWFRGGLTCICVVTSLPWVEYDMIRKGLIKESIDVFQWGYNGGGVAASAGTHDAGGCIDVNQYSDAHIRVWRDWGWAMQHRTPAQGFSHHAHGWPIGCPHMSAGARHQAAQWNNRTNGLASYGPITGPYTTENWKDALERNFYEMFTLNDIKKIVEDVVDSKATKIADTVLSRDDQIENNGVFSGNLANKYVALKTATFILGRRAAATEGKVDKVAKEIDETQAQLRALDAKLSVILKAVQPEVPVTPTVKKV